MQEFSKWVLKLKVKITWVMLNHVTCVGTRSKETCFGGAYMLFCLVGERPMWKAGNLVFEEC